MANTLRGRTSHLSPNRLHGCLRRQAAGPVAYGCQLQGGRCSFDAAAHHCADGIPDGLLFARFSGVACLPFQRCHRRCRGGVSSYSHTHGVQDCSGNVTKTIPSLKLVGQGMAKNLQQGALQETPCSVRVILSHAFLRWLRCSAVQNVLSRLSGKRKSILSVPGGLRFVIGPAGGVSLDFDNHIVWG